MTQQISRVSRRNHTISFPGKQKFRSTIQIRSLVPGSPLTPGRTAHSAASVLVRPRLRHALHVAVPTLSEWRRDAELVEHARYDMLDDIVDRFWTIVERRHRRNDCNPHAGQLQHVLKMQLGKRRLACYQHQFAALLEHNIGSAMY